MSGLRATDGRPPPIVRTAEVPPVMKYLPTLLGPPTCARPPLGSEPGVVSGGGGVERERGLSEAQPEAAEPGHRLQEPGEAEES